MIHSSFTQVYELLTEYYPPIIYLFYFYFTKKTINHKHFLIVSFREFPGDPRIYIRLKPANDWRPTNI